MLVEKCNWLHIYFWWRNLHSCCEKSNITRKNILVKKVPLSLIFNDYNFNPLLGDPMPPWVQKLHNTFVSPLFPTQKYCPFLSSLEGNRPACTRLFIEHCSTLPPTHSDGHGLGMMTMIIYAMTVMTTMMTMPVQGTAVWSIAGQPILGCPSFPSTHPDDYDDHDGHDDHDNYCGDQWPPWWPCLSRQGTAVWSVAGQPILGCPYPDDHGDHDDNCDDYIWLSSRQCLVH